jgi:mycofactocin precursor
MENEASRNAADTGAETGTQTESDTAGRITVTETAELVDELLIEEISIDGMCGVY